MFKDIFELYNKALPAYQMREDDWLSWLKPELAEIKRAYDGEKLAGFALIHGNSVALLCVDEQSRGRGFGSRLLEESEAFIKQAGANRVILGRGRHYILQGVPNENPDVVSFFEGRGYEAEWTSANMATLLDGFEINKLDIPPLSAEISFRFAEDADKSALLAAVEDADSSWVHVFEDCADPVMLAVRDGEIAGFQILAEDGARFTAKGGKIGCIGCVGVVHKARELGIGRRMVAEGMDWLKQRGCTAVELRYVAIVDWYRKLGFYVEREQWMGEKAL
ncbi:MAG: GNAT family N-acetyltransferase [Oscillospiraceae bacterium]|nr:GNAT family N-acetyltransferase [Oscillospiraceae bacterium]